VQVTYIDHCSSDITVVNAARVSFDKRSEPVGYFHPEGLSSIGKWVPKLNDKDQRLIKFLARHNHKSPFNHTFIVTHVKAPVFVARQLVKHKFMPWNEVSGRYVTFNPEFHDMGEYRKKAKDKKQGSGKPIKDPSNLEMIFQESHHSCFRRYKQALAEGLCEEQARALLPLDLMTQWYWSGTLGAWADMYKLRIQEDAQLETQEIARMASEIIEPWFPYSWVALKDS